MNTDPSSRSIFDPSWLAVALAIATSLAGSGAAQAIDGVVQINQARALAGGVTPADAPGFPVTISQPGSYRLTGPLDVSGQPNAADRTAIYVGASDVTLDLNGFTIAGPVTCSGSPVTGCAPSGSGFGVLVVSVVRAFHLRDGIVRGFASGGVVASDATIERVQAFSNGGYGIQVNGGVVDGCAAIANGLYGIAGGRVVIRSSRALDNGASGLLAQPGQVLDSEAVHNAEFGVWTSGGLAARNISRANGGCQLLADEGAYANNVLTGTGTLVCSGTQFGGNLCNGELCP